MSPQSSKARIALAATATLLLLGTAGIAQPAAAASVAAINCTGVTWVWNFEPALDLSGQTGSVFVYSDLLHNLCPYVAVSGLGAEEELIIFSGSFSAPYVGDCIHATVFMPDGEIHIFGGLLIVGFGGNGDASWQMVGSFPVPVCGFFSAPSVVNISVEAIDAKEITEVVAR